MAITNSQQYQQLVNKPANGKRPGYRGDPRDFGFNPSQAAANVGKASTAGQTGRAAPTGFSPSQASANVGKTSTGTRNRIQNEQNEAFRKKQLKELIDKQQEEKDFEPFETLMVKNTKVPAFIPGSTIMNLGLGATQKVRQNLLDNNVDFYRFDPRTRKAREKYGLDAAGYEEYIRARLAGEIDAAGNPLITGDQDPTKGNNFIPVDTTFNTDQEEDTDTEDDEFFRRFRADGGIMGGLADGQMDEMGRQMYGLGKLVKKATRAVKKIAKSPIGKAALIGGGLGLAGIGPFAGLRQTAFGKGLAGFFGEGSFNPFKTAITGVGKVSSPFGALASKVGITDLITGDLTGVGKTVLGLGIPMIAGALTAEQEAEAQMIADETGIDIQEIRNNPNKYLGRRFRAGGGLMRLGYQEGGDAEPVAKKTMPLIDMDGKEKDYRETGGFVDMGRMERADDVPARLSKNEFVFTADAVRNAGDGDVDKGAEVMYNMMKNLEAGGEVSEESQGVEGARRMFQTSQRLGEVI